MQDDPADISHGIENMDIIYERALMTVIAANGKDQTGRLTGIMIPNAKLGKLSERLCLM